MGVNTRYRGIRAMNHTRCPSVRTSIRRTILVAMSSVFFAALGLHTLLGLRDAEHATSASAVLRTEALATQLRADVPNSPADLQQACDRLLEHPAVLAVHLWDQTGRTVAAVAVNDGFLPLIDHPRHPGGPDVEAEPVELPTSLTKKHILAQRVEADLGIHLRSERPAHLALLLDLTPSLLNPAGSLGVFWIVFAAVGGVAFLLSDRHLRHRLINPILLLADALAAARQGDRPACLANHENELQTIAKSVVELQKDLGAWRERAERVERRLDKRLATETQRITRDLRRVQREAWRDPLTAINNRRIIDEKLPEILAAQRAAGQDLAVVMFDLDHFKTLNDTQGHKA